MHRALPLKGMVVLDHVGNQSARIAGLVDFAFIHEQAHCALALHRDDGHRCIGYESAGSEHIAWPGCRGQRRGEWTGPVPGHEVLKQRSDEA